MQEDILLEDVYKKLESATKAALENVIELLGHKDARARANASRIILDRTVPPRKLRTFKFDIKSMRTIDDILIAQEKIFFELITAKMNADEAQAYLSVIETMKNILLDVKYVNDILTFNEQTKKDEAFQASKNKSS